ncbi:hypothetical protein [Neobacillus terrae]|uniref:hypothetical protein n=1 Tax=Neobacillus terrae TaxID=3034837 RepID=UPI00140E22EE|nr:hypothetical protein [Neobacillus terrae]NHM30817.1 hypothetical protein [Neobacillus terrae]
MPKQKAAFLVILLVAAFLLGYSYFKNYYSSEGILEKVIIHDGYTLHQIKKPVTVEVYIKPEWIPFKNGKEKEVNIKLKEKNNTNIFLKDVINRKNDLYFSFTTTFNMSSNKGSFLYNEIFHEDGSFTDNLSPNDYYLYNNNHQKIEVGQVGQGPDSDFFFGITPDNYNLIKEGFYVKYSGFHLYKYSKD